MSEEEIEPGVEPFDPEAPEEIIDDITDTYGEIQEDLLEGAALAGHEKERYESIRQVWVRLASETVDDPDAADVYESAVKALSDFRDELRQLRPKIAGLTNQIRYVVPVSDSTSSVTGSTDAFISIGPVSVPTQTTLMSEERFQRTRRRLNSIDGSLADTYGSIWEVLYGTQSDPERGALYMTRQAIDHFFSILAPDEKVRESPYWSEKPDLDNAQLVTRAERIEYAAHTHVKEQSRRKTLLSSAKHMLTVYGALNKAHKRGELNELQAREALREMFKLIEAWAWSIESD